MIRSFLFAAFFCSVAAVPAFAADRYEIDTSHVFVGFEVSHLGFSTMHGRFNDVEGTFSFDQNDFEAGHFKVSIDPASVDTNFAPRDNHLRSPDFFNVLEFPSMGFESTAVKKTGKNKGKITGNLTLLGVSKPVALDFSVYKAAAHPFKPENFIMGFSAKGKIKRSDFGMKYAIPGVGDEITLVLEVEGIRQ
jgi:polyisoprenoid-binding protein YceI